MICVSLRMAASAETPLSPMVLPPSLQEMDKGSVRGGVLTQKANTVGGLYALKLGDLRLVEDGGKCSGAHVSDASAIETVCEQGAEGDRSGTCQGALTQNPALSGLQPWR